MASRFETRLAEGPPIVADGGMGSLLTAAVPRLRSPEEANLRAPEAVVSLHVSFINAGAELIETNTFGLTAGSSPPITSTTSSSGSTRPESSSPATRAS